MGRRGIGVVLLLALPAIGMLSVAVSMTQAHGPIVRTIAVGQVSGGGSTHVTQMDLALDAATRRAFVSNADDDTVSVLDVDSGALLSTVTLGPRGIAGYNPMPVVADPRDGHIFAGANGALYMLNATTGVVISITPLGQTPLNLAVDERAGRVFAMSERGIMSIFDARTAALLRHVDVNGVPGTLIVDAVAGRIAVLARDNSVRLLDARSGADLHVVSLTDTLTFLAADPWTGRLFVGSPQRNNTAGVLRMLDVRTGRVLRAIPVAPGAAWGHAVATRDGRLFVATASGGAVLVFNGRSGRLLESIYAGPFPFSLAVDGRRGRAFVLNGWGGALTVLGTRPGKVERTIFIGAQPTAVAVDEQGGHVFVVDSGGLEERPDPWQDVPAWAPRGLARWLPFLPPPGMRTLFAPPSVTVLDEARF